jgi:hypothetical protein
MKKLPIGIQDFVDLRNRDCIYIDKTAIIHQLITQGKHYFLSRPRRFGKSLLLSTLAAIFSGKKELFEGLAIASLPYDWKVYPVIAISMADVVCTSSDKFIIDLKRHLHNIGQGYNVDLDNSLEPSSMLQELVIKLSNKGKAVILIDEYDYPILKYLHSLELAEEMREVLKNFYIVIKGLDSYLHFVLLTGISKFSKTSIFSGLNNFNDISLHPSYNNLLGYTGPEIAASFDSYLDVIVEKTGAQKVQLLEGIKKWYDGYSFTYENDVTRMYNPFSVLLYLNSGRFFPHWFDTGTPTFLINLLKNRHYPVLDYENIKMSLRDLSAFEIDDINLPVLLFQAGYLTIKKYDDATRNFILDYPNKECTEAFSECVLYSMTRMPGGTINEIATRLSSAFNNNEMNDLKDIVTKLFATIPYTIHVDQEKYYQTVFYLMLKMAGAAILVEQATNIGRLDMVVETKSRIFILEFKINAPAKVGLDQVEKKKYYEPYLLLDKEISLIGISFDTALKNIKDFVHTELH